MARHAVSSPPCSPYSRSRPCLPSSPRRPRSRYRPARPHIRRRRPSRIRRARRRRSSASSAPRRTSPAIRARSIPAGYTVGRRVFEAGARNATWHMHTAGQLVFAEAGRGRLQIQGQPIKELGGRRERVHSRRHVSLARRRAERELHDDVRHDGAEQDIAGRAGEIESRNEKRKTKNEKRKAKRVRSTRERPERTASRSAPSN